MKGIILAGGSGTRLHPLTISVSKQLLPIYDKPMIYYPLSTLMLAGIRKILIISTPNDLPSFEKLLGTGENIGVEFSYVEQPSPDGLAQAFILGEEFIGNDDVCLILGDNIFYGSGLQKILTKSVNYVKKNKEAVIFGNYVNDPERYGVVGFDDTNKVTSIVEKPEKPKSNFAVVGLYFYPNKVVDIAKSIKPSQRGELEITSVNEDFLNINQLKVELFSRGFVWLDTGTHESLIEANEFVKAIEKRAGLKIACIEEIALKMGFISKEFLRDFVSGKSGGYFKYLDLVLRNNINKGFK